MWREFKVIWTGALENFNKNKTVTRIKLISRVAES